MIREISIVSKINIPLIRYATDIPRNPLPFPTLSMRANNALYMIGIDTYAQGKLLMEKLSGSTWKIATVGKVTNKELCNFFTTTGLNKIEMIPPKS